ncbi:MAG: hypothetical protein ACLQPN_15125 [Bryobacteraceae bacterium]
MRQASNILMAALIVAALFGGNCLSCPQMLMVMASHQPGHGCCHHPTPKIDCHSQVLSHFVKAQGGNVTPMFAAADAAPAIAAVAVATLPRPALAPWRAADVAPPDLLSLHSLLRI